MREYEMEVLEKYELEVNSTRRIRGAFYCDTKEGTMLLKETKISERRVPLLYLILNRLEKQGYLVDTPVFSKEGNLVQNSRDGTRYLMKKWYPGEECNLKREEDIFRAARKLGELHLGFQWYEPDLQEKEIFQKFQKEEVQEIPQNTQQSVCEEKKMDWTKLSPLLSKNPLEEMKRRNREMKKVRSFIRKRVAKNEFESYYLNHYEEIAWQAEKVTEQIERSGCQNLYERSIRERKMLHGDYNYHNVMILPENEVITNFERMRIGIQVDDLYYLLRKVMEKYHWKQKTGQNILEAYESVRQLKPDEREYLCLRLAYPEKFWKIANHYYNANKAWGFGRYLEKLEKIKAEEENREQFLAYMKHFAYS